MASYFFIPCESIRKEFSMEKTTAISPEKTLVRDCVETALLAVLIAVSGTFRIPGIVPGTEFQLSAPIAVAICGVFGFKKYIIAGVLASLMGLSLGTCTILNVAIQMSFRLGVGAFWFLSGSNRLFYIFSGPVGTALARVVMYFLLGKGLTLMLIAAAPGMAFTAATAWAFGKIFTRCREAVR